MDEIIRMIAGFFVLSAFFFWPIPFIVVVIILALRSIWQRVHKKVLNCPFLLRGDLFVAILAVPFYSLCSLLPYTQTKSVANLVEVVILASIWSVFLLIRGALSFFSISKYVVFTRVSNVFFYVVCILFAYFFPTLPE